MKHYYDLGRDFQYGNQHWFLDLLRILRILKMDKLKIGQIIELSPEQAQQYSNIGYVLRWIERQPHNKGEPNPRRYEIVGKHKKSSLYHKEQ